MHNARQIENNEGGEEKGCEFKAPTLLGVSLLYRAPLFFFSLLLFISYIFFFLFSTKTRFYSSILASCGFYMSDLIKCLTLPSSFPHQALIYTITFLYFFEDMKYVEYF